jgi:hypothetical protein
MATITALNSVFTISVTGLFPVPQQLQGYSVEDAFSTDAVDVAEVQMGVDGRMSAGFLPFVTKTTINLQADSASRVMFDTWLASQKAIRELYFCNGSITLPAISRTYALTRGVLTQVKQISDAKKVLQPCAYVITWESVSPSVL